MFDLEAARTAGGVQPSVQRVCGFELFFAGAEAAGSGRRGRHSVVGLKDMQWIAVVKSCFLVH
jgi:hypothetical protein